MANKKNTDKAPTGVSTLAVSLDDKFRAILKQVATKENKSEAHLARVAIASFLTAQGHSVPEVVESKKGPKAGANVNPAAAKAGLSNAELNKRIIHFLNHGGDVKKIPAQDWASYEVPHTPRAPKAGTATEQA